MLIEILFSVNFEVVGPCSAKPLFQRNLKVTKESVGDLTVSTFERFEVPYLGTERGMNSIYGTPIGDVTLEVISDTEMRSFGWCFDIDGIVPEIYPDKIQVVPQMKSIRWFYGFAHYKNGQWISQCEEAFKVKPKFACKNQPSIKF